MINESFYSSFIDTWSQSSEMHRLVRAEVVLDDVQCWSLFSECLDDNTGASANLTGLAFFVDLAEAGPFSQLLCRVDAQQRDLMLGAERLDELLVLGLVAGFGKDAEYSLTSRKRRHCH